MTRFQLKFTLGSPELPLDVDCVIVSFLRAGVQEEFHRNGLTSYTTKRQIHIHVKVYLLGPRSLSWGEVHRRLKILLDENYFSVTFSDPDMKELLQFYNAFRLNAERALSDES